MSVELGIGTELADNYRHILLRDGGTAQFDERFAVAAITPGMLIEYTAADEVQANSSAADTGPALLFAVEDDLQGLTIDDDYATDDLVKYVAVSSGDQVYAIASAAIAVGAKVESTGNGKVRTLTTGKPVGYVMGIAAAADGDRVILQII